MVGGGSSTIEKTPNEQENTVGVYGGGVSEMLKTETPKSRGEGLPCELSYEIWYFRCACIGGLVPLNTSASRQTRSRGPMDRTMASEAVGPGSIPGGTTWV